MITRGSVRSGAPRLSMSDYIATIPALGPIVEILVFYALV